MERHAERRRTDQKSREAHHDVLGCNEPKLEGVIAAFYFEEIRLDEIVCSEMALSS